VAARRLGRQDDCVIDNRGATVQIVAEAPDSVDARQALRAYYTEIVERYQGRPTNDAEIDQCSSTTAATSYVRRPARSGSRPSRPDRRMCGLRYIDPAGAEAAHPTLGEVTRVYVSALSDGRDSARSCWTH